MKFEKFEIENMKFEIRKFTMLYSKIRAKNNRKVKNDLENKLKDLENDLNNYDKLQKYNKIKSELEEIFEKFVEGAKVRIKCTWYEEGEKSTKFFLNLEKKRALQGQFENSLLATKKLWIKIKCKMSFNFFTEIFSNLTAQNHMMIVLSF